MNRCLSIKGAEDILNKPHAFEVSTTDDSMFFIADTDKVRLYHFLDIALTERYSTVSNLIIFQTLAFASPALSFAFAESRLSWHSKCVLREIVNGLQCT